MTLSQTEILKALFAEEWEFRLEDDPITATFVGDHRSNHLLPDLSETAFMNRKERWRAFLERLNALDTGKPNHREAEQQAPSSAASSAEDSLNRAILMDWLQDRLDDLDFGMQWMPLTRAAGPHTFLPDLIEVTPLGNETDYQNYLQRLAGMGAYLEAHIPLLEKGLQIGMTPPKAALQGIEDSIEAQLVDDPADSLFAAPFQTFPNGFSEKQKEAIRQNGLDLIKQSVIPGFRNLLSYLETEYLPQARSEPGLSTLPGGAEYYAKLVRRYTSLPLSPEQVHQTGLAEVRRIRQEMEQIIAKIGFQSVGHNGAGYNGESKARRFHDFLDYLRSEERFYARTPEALLQHAALVAKKMDGELPRLFHTLPRTPYGIRQIPDYIAPYTTTAYYFPPAGDGSTAGFYYVDTFDLKSRPLYEYEALTLHEAVPGHHLQIALQMELQTGPAFRRFADVTAFVEGWALYAERLGLEVGFYQDPYSDFGRLTFEMWRACRLVVDTGLHAFNWSRRQAIDYMADHTALSKLNIANEIDRYIGWPGQALAYKIGELKIRELRSQAEARLGERFDLRDFHEILLKHGAIPLHLLDEVIQNWITSTLACSDAP